MNRNTKETKKEIDNLVEKNKYKKKEWMNKDTKGTKKK